MFRIFLSLRSQIVNFFHSQLRRKRRTENECPVLMGYFSGDIIPLVSEWLDFVTFV